MGNSVLGTNFGIFFHLDQGFFTSTKWHKEADFFGPGPCLVFDGLLRKRVIHKRYGRRILIIVIFFELGQG